MRNQTGARFRSRKVVPKQNLVVYREHEVPDIKESGTSHRSESVVTTGVEKEEEEEHHLQEALHAAQTGFGKASVVIPTPDASRPFPDFEKYYAKGYILPKSYLKFSTQVEDCAGCQYNADEEDERWLAQHKDSVVKGQTESQAKLTVEDFEWIMWGLEKTTNDKLPGDYATLEDLERFILIENNSIASLKPTFPLVYEWWYQRRVKERQGRPIHPTVLTEDVTKSDDNPYVCFRRREMRQLRKTRKLDNQAIDKLRRLRHELTLARNLLELVAKREKLRKTNLEYELLIFEQKILVKRLRKKLGLPTRQENDPLTKTKKKRKEPRPYTVLLPLSRLQGLQDELCYSDQNAAEYKARKLKVEDQKKGVENCVEAPFRALELSNTFSKPLSYYEKLPVVYPATDLINNYSKWASSSKPCLQERLNFGEGVRVSTHEKPVSLQSGRRRVGRGGRIYYDRHVSWRQAADPQRGNKRLFYLERLKARLDAPNVDEDLRRKLKTQYERARYDDSSDSELQSQVRIFEDSEAQRIRRALSFKSQFNPALKYRMGEVIKHDELWQEQTRLACQESEENAKSFASMRILTQQWKPPPQHVQQSGSAVASAPPDDDTSSSLPGKVVKKDDAAVKGAALGAAPVALSSEAVSQMKTKQQLQQLQQQQMSNVMANLKTQQQNGAGLNKFGGNAFNNAMESALLMYRRSQMSGAAASAQMKASGGSTNFAAMQAQQQQQQQQQSLGNSDALTSHALQLLIRQHQQQQQQQQQQQWAAAKAGTMLTGSQQQQIQEQQLQQLHQLQQRNSVAAASVRAPKHSVGKNGSHPSNQ